MSVICLILGIFCLAYYALIVFYSGLSTDFSVFWAALGAVFLLLSLLVRLLGGHGGKGRVVSGIACGLITNSFHIGRSLLIARDLGFEDIHGIPAGSDKVLLLHCVVRESFALVKEEVLSIP